MAEVNPATERMTTVITSGVPKTGATMNAITAAGTTVLFMADLIESPQMAQHEPNADRSHAEPRAYGEQWYGLPALADVIRQCHVTDSPI
jgi:hypothetical protein